MASRYSTVASRDSSALDNVFITDRSSSCSDSQNGFSFSDLQHKIAFNWSTRITLKVAFGH